MAESKKPQPSILAPALAVAQETRSKQVKPIKMLTQNVSQEELVRPFEYCYCCRGYNPLCLQDISTKKTPLYKQGFGEGPQSSSTIPTVAPREVNQHLMGIQARAKSVPDMDLSD